MTDKIFTYKEYLEQNRRGILKEKYSQLKKITDKWGFIRQIYMEYMPEIIESAESRIRGKIDPYFIDWVLDFSPIEEAAWTCIRARGVPLYPQFPLFNFFIDFANPYHRIGLEMDGKDYHDSDKDTERDNFLAEYGWRVFRIPGHETMTKFKLPIELEEQGITGESKEREIENWMMNSCDGVVSAIDIIYFKGQQKEFMDLSYRSLYKHKLADFKIVDDE